MNANAPRVALRSLKASVERASNRKGYCCHAARLAAIRIESRRSPSRHPLSSIAPARAYATTTTSTSYSKPAASPSAPPASAQGNAGHYSATTPSKPNPSKTPLADLTLGLKDGSAIPAAPETSPSEAQVDWTRSFHGLSTTPFSDEAARVLLEAIPAEDIEIKPDGIIYLPEIKYRRILNRAFGPGAWGLAPRGETLVTGRSVTREYGLVVHGRLVSLARGEQQYFDPEGIPTATEGCKSNALMRCCKDLGIASELWDPVFIRSFLAKHSREVWVEHVTTKKKRKITVKKGVEGGGVNYPFKEVKG